MIGADLCLLPIHELAALIRVRAVSPVEVTAAYLERIERIDGGLHSYLTVTAERACADARRAEEEIARGAWRGPLHGIPVALKDLIDTAGIPTTANSRLFRDRLPTADAAVVERLSAAGAVLLGKLQLHEFAIGTPYPDDALPPARNPWHLDHMPGGSSSGSGAAIAAGLCAGALGSDTGGSVRHPAAHCGIVGLKPTYGLVSRRGLIPLSWTLDHVGPMARTVADVALLLQALAGHDPTDPASVPVLVPDYATALSGAVVGVRIGIPTAFLDAHPGIETDVGEAFHSALDVLRELGATVEEIAMPEAVAHLEAIYLPIMLCEALAYHLPWLRSRRGEYGRGFRQRVLPGISYGGADHVQALRGRAWLCRQFRDLMATIDLIAMPTVRQTAPTFAARAADTAPPRGFTSLFNVTGQPAISIPCGFDRQGLPVGLMLAGRHFEETTVLRAAEAFERAMPWHRRHPAIGVS